jgi:glycosyltransferase involved in cell wall biosynthesis
MAPRLKILFVCPFVPWPTSDGGRTRVYQLMKGAATQHQVELLSLGDTDQTSAPAAELRGQGFDVEIVGHRQPRGLAALSALVHGTSVYQRVFASRGFARALAARLRRVRYDIVQCEYAYMGQYVQSQQGPAWVLDEHNLEFRITQSAAVAAARFRDIGYRIYAAREWRLRQQEELAVCRQVDWVLTVSERDRQELQAGVPKAPVTVIPNGVDLDHFSPDGTNPSSDYPEIVFVGDLRYRPNRDGVDWFCREVWPLIRTQLPNLVLTVVGRADGVTRTLVRYPGVTVTDWVPDTRPYVRRATVSVVPLRSGSGTRFKILEGLAMGAAIVSTTAGQEGLHVESGRHLLTADTPADFAAAVIRLVRDPGQRRQLGRAGRQLVEEHYGWPRISQELEGVYRAVTRRPSKAPAS